MSKPLLEYLEKSLERWQTTGPNDCDGVCHALSRIYNRLGLPAPTVIWCDSPWQLAVAPFLTRLLCFNPTEVQRLRLGHSYDYGSLRNSIRQTLATNLTHALWQKAFNSVLSQLHPQLDKTVAGTTSDNQTAHSVPASSVLEQAAFRLLPTQTDSLDWNTDLDNAVKASLNSRDSSQTESALTAIKRRRASLIELYRDQLPETMDARGLYSMRQMRSSPQTLEAIGRLRIAFEQHYRDDTGLPIKEIDGSQAPWIGTHDVLALQFQQQIGDPHCRHICSLLTSSTELSVFHQVYDVFADSHQRGVRHLRRDNRPMFPLLPKCFGANNFAVVKNLVQSDVLPIAEVIRSYQLLWSNWSLDMLRIGMQLNDPDRNDRPELKEELKDLQHMLAGAFMYVLEDNVVYACRNPAALRLDERGQFHSYSAPAIEFADGYKMYFWQNIRVTEEVVIKPEILTVEYIAQEPNAEVRRVLIDRYGSRRYLVDSRATKVATDSVGVLFYISDPGKERVALVKVINCTAEPDGTYKEYFLRVPPTTKTPREGIAWTFGLRTDEYDPAVET